jgi:hypothetical protein
MSTPVFILSKIKNKLVLLILAPSLIIITILLLVTSGIHRYPLAVYSADVGFDMPTAGHMNISETLIKALDTSAFSLKQAKSPEEATRLYDSGAVKGMILFPEYFTEDLMIRMSDPSYEMEGKIVLRIADANPIARVIALSSVLKAAASAVAAQGGGLSLDSVSLPIDAKELVSGFAIAPAYIVQVLLGFIAYVITGIMALRAARDLREERRRIALRPFGSSALFTAAFALSGSLMYLSVVGAASAILGFGMNSRMLLAAAIVFALLCSSAALAFAAGIGSKASAGRVIPYFVLPLFFGGVILPIELLPIWLQWIKYIFPPYYGLGASMSIATRTPDRDLAFKIIATCVWALAFIVLGALLMKSRKGEQHE